MPQFPPIPSWEEMHPLIIHFPIALLLLTPLFVIISAALPPPRSRPYMLAAIFVLLLGTASLYVATSTGKAAAQRIAKGGEINAVLQSHRRFALETNIWFSELLIILAGMYLLPRVLRRRETRLFSTLLPLTFLALYAVGIMFLFNTAHAGGRLVHEFGAHAASPTAANRASASPTAPVTIAGAHRH